MNSFNADKQKDYSYLQIPNLLCHASDQICTSSAFAAQYGVSSDSTASTYRVSKPARVVNVDQSENTMTFSLDDANILRTQCNGRSYMNAVLNWAPLFGTHTSQADGHICFPFLRNVRTNLCWETLPSLNYVCGCCIVSCVISYCTDHCAANHGFYCLTVTPAITDLPQILPSIVCLLWATRRTEKAVNVLQVAELSKVHHIAVFDYAYPKTTTWLYVRTASCVQVPDF